MPIRVVKLGGSLLELDDLAERLRRWLEAESPAVNILIVGGGRFADAIRLADSRFRLGEEISHWLCIDAMSLSARVLQHVFPNATLIADPRALAELTDASRSTHIFDVAKFLRDVEPHVAGRALPHTWAVTSDSIAARVAQWLRADELVLLKSALPTDDVVRDSSRPYVDGFFATAARPLAAVRCVNLRLRHTPTVEWPMQVSQLR